MPITYTQRYAEEKVWARETSISSNKKFAHNYGINSRSKYFEGTIVELKQELIRSGYYQE